MPLDLDFANRKLAAEALQAVINRANRVSLNLSSMLAGVAAPPSLTAFEAEAIALRDAFTQGGPNDVVRFDPQRESLELLRAALAVHRRELAERIEFSQRNVVAAPLSRALDATLEPLNSLLSHPSLARVIPRALPSLADFVTHEARQGVDVVPSLSVEEREQKHKVLLSAAIITSDLAVYRVNCENRRLPFAVVFADLDDFKKVNARHGEVAVDRQVLPRILASVEAAAYGHGRAYRHGGDEFVLLIPNAGRAVIESLVLQLKESVERLDFGDLDFAPRLSAGVWVTVPSSHLTAAELVHQAALAKAASKEAGKSRITLRSEVGSEYSQVVIGAPATN